MDISTLTVASASAALSKGEISSVELTQSVIDAVDAKDGAIGAYLTFDREGALRQAAEADAARAVGKSGSLLGIPVAIKDLINVAGQPCTCASKILEGYVSPYDATVSAKLREAGAVFAGRVNMDEFAMGSSTENSAFKITHNPHDLSRVPGGSSGGSAASVPPSAASSDSSRPTAASRATG